jgi:hypothetical protein
MKPSSSFFVLFLILIISVAPGLQAAIEKELGQALAYVRVTDANSDVALAVDTIERRPALVLDLRSLSAAEKSAMAIRAALARPPAPHAVRFVLINASTAPALLAALNDDTFKYVITLGPRSPGIAPDVAVSISDEEDLRAYAALAAGTPLEKLITDNHEKPRYDEAKLVLDHSNGITPPDSLLPADADDDSLTTESDTEKKIATTKKPAPPVDLVLERAVQIHRSLLALKKL